MNQNIITEKDFQVEIYGSPLFNINTFFIISLEDCILIDPIFEPKLYDDLISGKSKKLKYIFLTKKPFEYISNYEEIANKYKVEIIYIPNENTIYNFGNVSIKSSKKGGFTEDSINYILINSDKKEKAVFTGGNILIGTIGNPYYKELDENKKNEIKEKLYNDIQYIKSLDPKTYIFPTYSNENGNCVTIEKEYTINQFFNLSKEDFFNKINFQQYNNFYEQISTDNYGKDKLISERFNLIKQLSPLEVNNYSKDNDIILIDTRPLSESKIGYIKNSIFFPRDISFCNWTIKLLFPLDKYLLIIEKNKEEEILKNFFRLGFPNIIGFINYEDYIKENYPSEKILVYETTKDSIEKLVKDKKYVIDIREIPEYIETGIIENCQCFPFSTFRNNYNLIPKESEIYITCKGGGRAAMAITYLLRKGYNSIFYNIEGGMMKVIKSGYSTFKYEKK